MVAVMIPVVVVVVAAAAAKKNLWAPESLFVGPGMNPNRKSREIRKYKSPYPKSSTSVAITCNLNELNVINNVDVYCRVTSIP